MHLIFIMPIKTNQILILAILIGGSVNSTSCTTSARSNKAFYRDIDRLFEVEDAEYEEARQKEYEFEIEQIQSRLIDVVSQSLNIEKKDVNVKLNYANKLSDTPDMLFRLIKNIEKSFSITIHNKEIDKFESIESFSNIIWKKINPICEKGVGQSTYDGVKYPENLLYTEDGLWLKIEANLATVGVSFSPAILGHQFVYITELPRPNTIVAKGQEVALFEQTKAIYEITSPVSGLVVKINHKLKDCPAVIDSDPYGKGWVMKIIMSDFTEIEGLLSAKEYRNIAIDSIYR